MYLSKRKAEEKDASTPISVKPNFLHKLLLSYTL